MATNLPVQRCFKCGTDWVQTHTCPNAPRSTSNVKLLNDPVEVIDVEPTGPKLYSEMQYMTLRSWLAWCIGWIEQSGHPVPAEAKRLVEG